MNDGFAELRCARLTELDGKPVIAFRSWFDSPDFEAGDLIVAAAVSDTPQGPEDWHLIRAGGGEKVAYSEATLLSWIALTSFGDEIGCAYVSAGSEFNLGFIRSKGNILSSSPDWVKCELALGPECSFNAITLVESDGLPIIAVACNISQVDADFDRISVVKVCRAINPYPSSDTDWEIQTAFKCTDWQQWFDDLALPMIEVGGKPAVFFSVDDTHSRRLHVAAAEVQSPSDAYWASTDLFSCIFNNLGGSAADVTAGVVRVLYRANNHVMLAQCPETSILDFEKWDTAPVQKSKGLETGYGFLDGRPVITRLRDTRNRSRLVMLLATTREPQRKKDWLTFVIHRGPAICVTITTVNGKPAISYFTVNPDRVCYAYALNSNPRTNSDWQVCTVAGYNLDSDSELEAANSSRGWIIGIITCGFALVIIISIWWAIKATSRSRVR